MRAETSGRSDIKSDTRHTTQRKRPGNAVFPGLSFGGGGRIRTCDLRVMSDLVSGLPNVTCEFVHCPRSECICRGVGVLRTSPLHPAVYGCAVTSVLPRSAEPVETRPHIGDHGVWDQVDGTIWNPGTCAGLTTEKCRRSRVAIVSCPSRSARATRLASVPPSGRSVYFATRSAIRARSSSASTSIMRALLLVVWVMRRWFGRGGRVGGRRVRASRGRSVLRAI